MCLSAHFETSIVQKKKTAHRSNSCKQEAACLDGVGLVRPPERPQSLTNVEFDGFQSVLSSLDTETCELGAARAVLKYCYRTQELSRT